MPQPDAEAEDAVGRAASIWLHGREAE